MKKLFLALAILGLAGCSSDDEQPKVDSEVAAVLSVLNGKFCAEQYSTATNTTEHWDYTFTPFDEPQDISYSIKANGKAHYEHYFNDHVLGGTYEQYYIVSVPYKGADASIRFYDFNEQWHGIEKEYVKTIKILSPTSFVMDGHTFTRQ